MNDDELTELLKTLVNATVSLAANVEIISKTFEAMAEREWNDQWLPDTSED